MCYWMTAHVFIPPPVKVMPKLISVTLKPTIWHTHCISQKCFLLQVPQFLIWGQIHAKNELSDFKNLLFDMHIVFLRVVFFKTCIPLPHSAATFQIEFKTHIVFLKKVVLSRCHNKFSTWVQNWYQKWTQYLESQLFDVHIVLLKNTVLPLLSWGYNF